MTEATAEGRAAVTLGRHLQAIRKDRGMTLRQVEEATNREVSNAYLSQIENDKIQKPSPNILHKLASLYGASYEGMMELAGYIAATRKDDERHGRLPTFAEINLTSDEEAQMLRYLQFLRSSRGPS